MFLIHPVRQRRGTLTLVTLYTGTILPLDSTPEISILSLEHFYDSFRVVPMACLRSEVLAKYNLTPDMLTGDLRVSQRTAAALSRPDVRDLVPEDNAEESENDPVSGWSERTPRDVRDPEGDVAMSQSSWTSSEDTSAVVSDADDVEQDHELFLEAYSSFKNQSGIFDSQKGLQDWFEGVERLPNSWPMARLSITLDGLVMQVEKVAMTAAMEIVASHIAPEECLPELTRLAKDLTVALALHLADLVASFLTGVLAGQTVLLFGTNTAALLQASYWVRPIFEELLYVSAHGFQGAEVEARRASNGLVKIVSGKTASAADRPAQTSSSCTSPMTILGQSLTAGVLQIWFPAHRALRVASRIQTLGGTALEFKAEHVSTAVPHVRCGIKLPDQSLNVERLLPSFPTVYQGIVRGVFRQQAGGAWFPCKTLKIFITVIMPQSSDPHHWFAAVGSREGSWPMELPNPRPLLRRVSLRTFSRMRKRTLTPHLWYKLVPNWSAGHTWQLPQLKQKLSSERNLTPATTKTWWTNLPNLMSGLPTPRDGRLHGLSWLASRGLSFPFLICTLMTFLRLWLPVTQKGMTFGCAFWRLMSTWQCGVMIMVAFGGANSSFTQYLFHMARKSAHA